MSNLFQTLHVKLLRYINGRSPFRNIVILTIIALSLIFLSKLQLFKMELQANENGDLRYNPKILKNEKTTYHILKKSNIIISSTLMPFNVTTKLINSKLIFKKPNMLPTIFSALTPVIFNVSFNLVKDNLVKIALNDILLKGLNEESQKLQNSLNEKPLDYDKNARFCICSKISQPCICCVKLAEENIGLTKSLCSNVTYLPKIKAAKIGMQYGDSLKSNSEVLIDINNPPSVCLSEFVKYEKDNADDGADKTLAEEGIHQIKKGNFTLDVCFLPKNLTYNVNIDTTHRTEFKGCSNIIVKLNNMTIHVYPLGCFKAGHDSKELQIQKVANGIP